MKIGIRRFLKRITALGAGLSVPSLSRCADALEADRVGSHWPQSARQPEPDGFFTLGKWHGHWWLITPDGHQFFTMGVIHIDPAMLGHPEYFHLWREKCGGSTLRWIRDRSDSARATP